jgi:hypothetical protein
MNNPYAPPAAPPKDEPDEPRTGRRLPYSGWWAIAGGAFAGLVLRLIYWGSPGDVFAAMMGSFIYGAPLLVGVVTVYLAERIEPRSWVYHLFAPMLATALFVTGTLLLLVEGWICAILIIPLFAVFGGFAGLLMGLICRLTRWPRRSIVSSFALLPLLGGAFENDLPAPDSERVQQREVFIAADPAQVWRQLADVRDIRPDEVDSAWMYRIGVPLPSAGAGEFAGGEHLRHVTMGKGIHFDQVATEWRENESVTWRYRFAPDSFPPRALDDHVRIGGQYFDLGDSTYTLIARDGGTLLSLRMRYRVSTHFNWYAGRVADFLVGDFGDVILRFYAERAEKAPAAIQPAGAS